MPSWQSGNSREPLPLYMALCMTSELSSGQATLAFPPWDHYFACSPPRRAMFPCKTSSPAPRLRSTTPKGALPTWTVTLQSNHARWPLPTISGENYSVSSPPMIDLCLLVPFEGRSLCYLAPHGVELHLTFDLGWYNYVCSPLGLSYVYMLP